MSATKQNALDNPLAFLENHFDADKMTELEASLMKQTSGDAPYDFENNLAMLKLYQSHPSLVGKSNGERNRVLILTQALMNMPAQDFKFLKAIIPAEDIKASKALTCLVDLHDQLNASNFPGFWNLVKQTTAVDLKSVKNFRVSVRAYILSVLRCAYRKIQHGALLKALDIGFGTPEAKDVMRTEGYTLEGADGPTSLVVFPANKNNQDREKKFKETLKLENITSVLGILSGSN